MILVLQPTRLNRSFNIYNRPDRPNY